MNYLDKYLNHLASIPKDGNLIIHTAGYLRKEFNFSDIVILAHYPRPQPFEIIYSARDSFDLEAWSTLFATNTEFPGFMERTRTGDDNVYFLNEDYNRQTGYLLLTGVALDEPHKEVLVHWHNLYKYLSAKSESHKQYLTDYFANYISQIIHDSQSIIHLGRQANEFQDLQQRLEYQEKCNRNILMDVREPELFLISVNPADFISDSLDLIEINAAELNINIDKELEEITLDLELMSRVLNEIVKNAITATSGDFSKISVTVNRVAPASFLHDFEWIKIEIEDKGEGINDEFINQATNPFFTTRKYRGATGFGLTLTKKLTEAHGGTLIIESEQGRGTKVTIFIPQDMT